MYKANPMVNVATNIFMILKNISNLGNVIFRSRTQTILIAANKVAIENDKASE